MQGHHRVGTMEGVGWGKRPGGWRPKTAGSSPYSASPGGSGSSGASARCFALPTLFQTNNPGKGPLGVDNQRLVGITRLQPPRQARCPIGANAQGEVTGNQRVIPCCHFTEWTELTTCLILLTVTEPSHCLWEREEGNKEEMVGQRGEGAASDPRATSEGPSWSALATGRPSL